MISGIVDWEQEETGMRHLGHLGRGIGRIGYEELSQEK